MKLNKYIFLLPFMAAPLLFTSCGDDSIENASIITIPEVSTDSLDVWIDSTFRVPYNMNVNYKWTNFDSDQNRYLVPPRKKLVQPFLKTVKKIWIKPYITVASDKEEFFKNYANRELKLIGSGSWNNESVTLGLAENGFKISLYTINSFDLQAGVSKDDLRQFFRTMHHEFGHILNQRKPYSADFKKITGGYTADWTSFTDSEAREMGFMSAYSISGDGEDFVEILSFYVCYTSTEWAKIMSDIKNETSKENIQKKVNMVASYMNDSYGVDIEQLRVWITAGISEAASGNLD